MMTHINNTRNTWRIIAIVAIVILVIVAIGVIGISIARKHAYHQLEKEYLILSAGKGRLDIVKILLASHPGWVNFHDNNGQTPLIVAVANDHITVVAFLVSHGADKSPRDAFGMTAKDYAVKNGDIRILTLLDVDSKVQPEKTKRSEKTKGPGVVLEGKANKP